MVKLFLKKPSNNQGLVQKVLQLATADSDNPDIRDRAYIYWRLLSGDLDVAKVRPPFLPTTRAPLTPRSEHHPRPKTPHHHHREQPPPAPPRIPPLGTLHPRLGLPQAPRVLRRQGPLRRRSHPARRHPGTTPKRRRGPHRRVRRRRERLGRPRRAAEQRGEFVGYRL